MNESYCRCPGCGECRAHANEPKLKEEIKHLKAKRKWVGLTDEEIEQGLKGSWVTEQAWQSAVWWAETKLKEKNT